MSDTAAATPDRRQQRPSLRPTWAQGSETLGVWLSTTNSIIAEIAGATDADYVCIDTQHGAVDYHAAVPMIQGIELGGGIPIARVPWNEPGAIGKLLDAGCHGVIVPMVNDRSQAEAVVRACRYAPDGSRSWGPTVTQLRHADNRAWAADTIAVIPMIETVEALANLDEIVSTPGIDAVYVGPADLSISLGCPEQYSHPRFLSTVDRILLTARAHGLDAVAQGQPQLGRRELEVAEQREVVCRWATWRRHRGVGDEWSQPTRLRTEERVRPGPHPFDGDARVVGGRHRPALLGEPDGVAPLAGSDVDGRAGSEGRDDLLDEAVGLGRPDQVSRGVSLVPVLGVHLRPPLRACSLPRWARPLCAVAGPGAATGLMGHDPAPATPGPSSASCCLWPIPRRFWRSSSWGAIRPSRHP